MYICYIDESGTSDIPGNTSHFILAGVSIPVSYWKAHDNEIEVIKKKYGLGGIEIHVGWILRPYHEQMIIPNFNKLLYNVRKSQVERWRNNELLKLQKARDPKRYKQIKKNFIQTRDYIHLTYDERKAFVIEVASRIGQWGVARLFAECVDKTDFDPSKNSRSIDEQCFEQVVSRFEHYLESVGSEDPNCLGVLIHDNNETVAKKHTLIMRDFHSKGTSWTTIPKIIETPLFVDSKLTSMIQIADLCAYSLRRYLENKEEELFDLIFPRADRRNGIVVGVRHFTNPSCNCKICTQHKILPKILLDK